MDFETLVRAIETLDGEQAFHPRLGPAHWRTLAGYMAPRNVAAGELAVARGKQVSIAGWVRPVKKR